MALVSRRFTGGILALALLAVMGASALQLDGLFDTLELDGDLTWNGEVYDEPNSGDASSRTFFRGDGSWASVGLQDAAHAILTSDTSTMSSTYVDILIADVYVGEAGDAVRVDVTAQLGWMGAGLFIVEDTRGFWMLSDLGNAGSATEEGRLGVGPSPSGMTICGGTLYVSSRILPARLYSIPDPSDPGKYHRCRSVPCRPHRS